MILLILYFKINMNFFIFHQNIITIEDIISRSVQIKSTLLKHSYHILMKYKKKIFTSLYFDIRIKIGQNLVMQHFFLHLSHLHFLLLLLCRRYFLIEAVFCLTFCFWITFLLFVLLPVLGREMISTLSESSSFSSSSSSPQFSDWERFYLSFCFGIVALFFVSLPFLGCEMIFFIIWIIIINFFFFWLRFLSYYFLFYCSFSLFRTFW